MDKNEWNQKIKSWGGEFLQSWEWGEFQKRLGNEVVYLSGAGYAALLIEKKLPGNFFYFYAPRGPVIERTADFDTFLDDAKRLALERGAIFLKVEPLPQRGLTAEKLKTLGLKLKKYNQPQTVRRLNLRVSEEALLEKMEYETRYAIRTAAKRGILVKRYDREDQTSVFETFWQLFLETNARQGLRAYDKQYYENLLSLNGELISETFIAELERVPVSAAIILYFHDTAVYFYAASQSGYGKYNAPSLLLWEAIRRAKSKGERIFDLWGVDKNNKRWEGITRFKKGFGGYEAAYLGTWDWPLNKKVYGLYNLFKAII